MPLNFTGLFVTDAAYQQAQAEFLGIDTPSVLADAAWGLHPIPRLTVGMTAKLANVPQTTVNVRGVAGRMPTGSTSLFGTPAIGGNPVDLTMVTAVAAAGWVAANPGAAYVIAVDITTGNSTRFAGTIVEILNHELSAHAEPFADFLIAELAAPGTGVWETVDVQHARLGTGDTRYRLIGARYVTGFHGADQEPRYRVRMSQDNIANATLPPGV
jgi:hypothetical protein